MITVTLEMPKGKHFKSWLNDGNWQKIIFCEDCTSYYAIDDINEYEPCRHCGGFLSGLNVYVGKWIEGKWARRIQANELL